MASVHRDADGWVDRVNYMKEITHFATAPAFTDEKAADVAAYLNTLVWRCRRAAEIAR